MSVASATGLSATGVAERVPGARAVSADEVIDDPQASLVAIATRHDSHAALAGRALRAGKAVFVEKPPCLTYDELADLRQAREESGQVLFVGFNRRHAPLIDELERHVAGAGHPVEILIRVNAGALPAEHWLNDPARGRRPADRRGLPLRRLRRLDRRLGGGARFVHDPPAQG